MIVITIPEDGSYNPAPNSSFWAKSQHLRRKPHNIAHVSDDALLFMGN